MHNLEILRCRCLSIVAFDHVMLVGLCNVHAQQPMLFVCAETLIHKSLLKLRCSINSIQHFQLLCNYLFKFGLHEPVFSSSPALSLKKKKTAHCARQQAQKGNQSAMEGMRCN